MLAATVSGYQVAFGTAAAMHARHRRRAARGPAARARPRAVSARSERGCRLAPAHSDAEPAITARTMGARDRMVATMDAVDDGDPMTEAERHSAPTRSATGGACSRRPRRSSASVGSRSASARSPPRAGVGRGDAVPQLPHQAGPDRGDRRRPDARRRSRRTRAAARTRRRRMPCSRSSPRSSSRQQTRPGAVRGGRRRVPRATPEIRAAHAEVIELLDELLAARQGGRFGPRRDRRARRDDDGQGRLLGRLGARLEPARCWLATSI